MRWIYGVFQIVVTIIEWKLFHSILWCILAFFFAPIFGAIRIVEYLQKIGAF